jgi:uracil-DNA glycosylase
MSELDTLLTRIRDCRLCEAHLPLGPNPVLRAQAGARLLIVGQAPGVKVPESSIPWNDASGIRLRHWLGLDREQFYDGRRIAIVPMGFCYPGKGTAGDLPPRPECAPTWHPQLLPLLPQVRLTLLIGHYAQVGFLGAARGRTLTDTVRDHARYQPAYFPLPHPSPRNQLWVASNPWFDADVVPALRRAVAEALAD